MHVVKIFLRNVIYVRDRSLDTEFTNEDVGPFMYCFPDKTAQPEELHICRR